jgi:hypothetical protein
MANASYTYKEVRFTGLDGELTHCFVWITAQGDAPIGVQGWHHKAFPPSVSLVDIAKNFGKDDPILWPLCAPGDE